MDKHLETKCTEIVLSERNKIKLHRFFEIDSKTNKKHIIDLLILADDETITKSFGETIQFKEELNLFFKGDSQNKFLKLVQRKLDGKEVKSLSYCKKNKNCIYINQSEAKTIVTLINISLAGFSLTKLYESDLTDAYGLHLLDMFKNKK